jgi:hypothetical protein
MFSYLLAVEGTLKKVDTIVYAQFDKFVCSNNFLKSFLLESNFQINFSVESVYRFAIFCVDIEFQFFTITSSDLSNFKVSTIRFV